MSVRLTPEEVEEFLTEGHELIFTTIGADGYPHPIPVWYLYLDGAIYVRSIASLQKVVNAQRNPKVAGVVSSGEAWVDLKAVIFRGEAEVVTDEAEQARFQGRFAEKYAPYRRPVGKVPEATNRHYARPSATIKVRIDPARVISWHNRKLRMRE
jgi:nitroimidazol reductase NimA-like FMN-containing flavoprotein (pyridoxamine 5'-phosphate oxidase superfamily)